MKKSELTKLIKESYQEVLAEQSNYSPIHKFMYFGWNFPGNFIDEVWADDPNLATHLKSKFKQAYEKGGSHNCMFEFYPMLSSGNQTKLENWVLKNFEG